MGDIAALVKSLESEKIAVYKPGDIEYEGSVACSNLLYRYSRPTCVVQPERSSDVQTIVREAKAHNIPITIKNGGHSYAGFSTTNQGILLHLEKMKRVDLDMESKTVTLQGGALWHHAYEKLVRGRHDGYIVNGGRCPTLGVSGFTLGGGIGPFTRSFGMGCDTLNEVTIVTADGNEVVVKKSDDPTSDKGKLFWALCGAGGGNFGVVVELKMDLQTLQNPDGNVVAGRYTWYPTVEAMDDFMATMNDFYTVNWPDQLTIDSTWICDLAKDQGDLAVRFSVYYDGTKDNFDRLMDRSLHKDLAKKLKRRTLSEKSSRFLHESLEGQRPGGIIEAFPSNPAFKVFTSFVFKNDRDRIQSITSIIKKEMTTFKALFKGEKSKLTVSWIHSGGEASRKKRSATAFRWRDGVYHTYIMVEWKEKWLERDMKGFLQIFKEKLRPFSLVGRAAYINFADGAMSPNAHERAYFGNNRHELQRIRKIWDKDNYFNWSQGVRLPQPKKTSSRSKPTTFARMRRMAFYTPSTSIARAIAEKNGHDAECVHALMAADEEFSEDGSAADEQALTDTIAGRNWEAHKLPPL